jgi:YggT family protein
MFVFGNALASIATLIGTIAQIYVFVLIGYIIVSWVNADPLNPIVRFIRVASDPLLDRIRRFVPPIAGIQGFVVSTLMDWARQLR